MGVGNLMRPKVFSRFRSLDAAYFDDELAIKASWWAFCSCGKMRQASARLVLLRDNMRLHCGRGVLALLSRGSHLENHIGPKGSDRWLLRDGTT